MTGVQWASGAGTAWWLVVGFGLVGAGLGTLTGRVLATGDYRIDSDEPSSTLRHWWWPGLALGAAWSFLAWRIGDAAGWAGIPAYLLFAWFAVGLLWIDADVHRLPDGLVLPAYPALLVMLVVGTAGLGEWAALVRALACMAALYAVYFLMALISPSSLGFGDVKLAGVIGLVLGWVGVGTAVLGILAGFLVGGLVAVVFLVGRRAGLRSHIAYGPSMLVGAFVALAVEFHTVA